MGYDKEYAVTVASFRAGDIDGTWFDWAIQREEDGVVTIWRERTDQRGIWDYIGECDSWEQAQTVARREADHSRQSLREHGVTVRF